MVLVGMGYVEIEFQVSDDILSGTAYRKPTHTNSYLKTDLQHHLVQSQSVVKTSVIMSHILSNEQHESEKLKKLYTVYLQIGLKREIPKEHSNLNLQRKKTEKTQF